MAKRLQEGSRASSRCSCWPAISWSSESGLWLLPYPFYSESHFSLAVHQMDCACPGSWLFGTQILQDSTVQGPWSPPRLCRFHSHTVSQQHLSAHPLCPVMGTENKNRRVLPPLGSLLSHGGKDKKTVQRVNKGSLQRERSTEQRIIRGNSGEPPRTGGKERPARTGRDAQASEGTGGKPGCTGSGHHPAAAFLPLSTLTVLWGCPCRGTALDPGSLSTPPTTCSIPAFPGASPPSAFLAS